MARVVSGFRSGLSRKPCWLQVVNRTPRTVSIIWIDYYGRETNYGVVEPRTVKSIHSYEGHPWLCRDIGSKRRLLLNNSELFIPSAGEPDPHGQVSSFVEVVISLPLFRLQDICTDLISRYVSNENDIQNLELPNKLKDHIIACFRNMNSE